MFKKVKVWMKEHKKEIIISALSVGGTALYFLCKKKKIGVRAGINLTLRFIEGSEDEEDWFRGYYNSSKIYSSIDLDNPNLALSDLGKLGDILKEKIFIDSEDAKIGHLSASYSLLAKK